MSENRERVIELGRKAKQMQEDEFFKQVLVSITSDLVKQLVVSTPGTNEAIAVHAELRAVDRIQQQLTRIVNAGKVAESRS
jgi:hypothetical protein